jgi:hypothetical protein
MENMLKEKIINKEAGILTYGMTPPKETTSPEKLAEISWKQYERLKDLDIDGLILYDVQEETDRMEEERPFPYLPTMDPSTYSKQYLNQLKVPKIIYSCVGKYSEVELSKLLKADDDQDRFSVFVGASSQLQDVKLSLTDSYKLSKIHEDTLVLGGVVIPERHVSKKDEHLRMMNKVKQGCKFFVSQATYHIEASKNLLSDYYYYCRDEEIEMVPILFNLAPCGSHKTLAFMKWLGISIPSWLENDFIHCNDILEKSITHSKKIFEELYDFGMEKGIPVGCSVESVSTRKVEIEASVQLVKDIKIMIQNYKSSNR